MSVAIKTGSDYIDTIKRALDLTEEDDQEILRGVFNTARGCPVCGAKPILLANKRSKKSFATDRETKKTYGAAQLVCRCGRSSALYDERDRLDRDDPNAWETTRWGIARMVIGTW